MPYSEHDIDYTDEDDHIGELSDEKKFLFLTQNSNNDNQCNVITMINSALNQITTMHI